MLRIYFQLMISDLDCRYHFFHKFICSTEVYQQKNFPFSDISYISCSIEKVKQDETLGRAQDETSARNKYEIMSVQG